MHQRVRSADQRTSSTTTQFRPNAPRQRSRCGRHRVLRALQRLRGRRGAPSASGNTPRPPRPHNSGRGERTRQTVDAPARGSRRFGTAALPRGRCRAGLLPASLAEALEVLPVRGQVARPLLESPDATPGKLESASTTTFLLGDQLQSTTDKFGVALPGLLLQVFEGGPVFLTQARMNVLLHSATVAQAVTYVLQRSLMSKRLRRRCVE